MFECITTWLRSHSVSVEQVGNELRFKHSESQSSLLVLKDGWLDGLIPVIGDELRAAPQIDAVVVRSLIQMTHVISLKPQMRDAIFSVLVQPSNKDFPTAHGVIYDRAEKAERVKVRAKQKPATNTSGVLCWPVEMRKDLPQAPEMEGLYNISIPSRKPGGEPVYEVIPKFLDGN